MPHERCALCGIDTAFVGGEPVVPLQQIQNLEQVLLALRQGQIHEEYVRLQRSRMCLLCCDVIIGDDDPTVSLEDRLALILDELSMMRQAG